MPHSLRAKLSGLRYKGILEDKDYKRLCHALDLEKAEQEPTKQREKELAEEWKCGYEMGFEEAKVLYEQEPCDDAISRNDMLDAVGHGTTYTTEHLQKIINGLPSVEPTQKSVENTLETRCEDAVSRQAVLDCATLITSIPTEDWDIGDWVCLFRDRVSQLPSVQPKAKTGHWIEDKTTYAGQGMGNYKCSVCDRINGSWIKDMPSVYPNFCWWCGAEMKGEQE